MGKETSVEILDFWTTHNNSINILLKILVQWELEPHFQPLYRKGVDEDKWRYLVSDSKMYLIIVLKN